MRVVSVVHLFACCSDLHCLACALIAKHIRSWHILQFSAQVSKRGVVGVVGIAPLLQCPLHCTRIAMAESKLAAAGGSDGAIAAVGSRCALCNIALADTSNPEGVKLSVNTVRCTECHANSTAACRTFGSWPPPEFKALGEEDRQQFWCDLRQQKLSHGSHGKGNFKMDMINQLSSILSKVDTHATSGAYQPLGYYKTLGYDVTAIEERCSNWKVHPVLGKVYCVDIEMTSSEVRKERLQTQLLKRADAAKLRSKQTQASDAALKSIPKKGTAFSLNDDSEDGASTSDTGDSSSEESEPVQKPKKARKDDKKGPKKGGRAGKDKKGGSASSAKRPTKSEIKNALKVLKDSKKAK